MFTLKRLFAGRSARPFAIAVVLALAQPVFGAAAGPSALTAGEQAYARHDYARAAPLLRAEAERGSPDAQTYLGYMYMNGFLVTSSSSRPAGSTRRRSRGSRRRNFCSAWPSTRATA